MTLKFAILAALLEGEASGYGLSKRFDSSVANFWPASQQQLYRELGRLEGDGLVAGRKVPQDGRPDKRLFRPTEAGLEALAAFTAAAARPVSVRDELLVKIQAVDVGNPALVSATVADRVASAERKLAQYDELRDQLLDGRSEEEYLREASRVGPYLTLMRGRAFEQGNITWGRTVLDVLHRRMEGRGLISELD